ncbi:MAG TPA: lipocalin family protein [Xanthomonadaceae bacterium]|jgi:apolipoprotein D and lipocalin family protein
MNTRPSTHVPAIDASQKAVANNRPVDWLDLKRYLGNWYEIAYLPTQFERDCSDLVTATYSRDDHGTIRVRNTCRTFHGDTRLATGIVRPTEIAGALKVSFAPRWLSWLPFTWADYWVIDLDSSYHWAVVGGPSRKYLWILARTQRMPRALFTRLKLAAASKGYAIDRLIVPGEVV